MNPAFIVFSKELREMLRDKRVVQSAVIGPVFLVFVFVFLFGFLQGALDKPKGQKLYYVAVDPMPSMLAEASKSGKYKLVRVPNVKKAEELVRSGDAPIVLMFPPDFDRAMATEHQVKISVIFDEEQPASKIEVGTIKGEVAKKSAAAVKQLLTSRGISEKLAEPIQLVEKPVKRERPGLGGMIASMMPYLIVIWAFYGGMSLAGDLVAGEKERFTLETLLISPIPRVRIALGKFLALAMLCLASSLSSLIAVVVAGNLPIHMFEMLFPNGVHVTPISALSMLAVIVPLAAMFSGLLLAISAKARNIREAQSYLTLVSFVVLMPAIFSQVIGYTEFAKAAWVNWVPILNSAMVLRSAMLGNFDAVAFLTTLSVNVLLAAIALWAVVAMFQRESVLWRI